MLTKKQHQHILAFLKQENDKEIQKILEGLKGDKNELFSLIENSDANFQNCLKFFNSGEYRKMIKSEQQVEIWVSEYFLPSNEDFLLYFFFNITRFEKKHILDISSPKNASLSIHQWGIRESGEPILPLPFPLCYRMVKETKKDQIKMFLEKYLHLKLNLQCLLDDDSDSDDDNDDDIFPEVEENPSKDNLFIDPKYIKIWYENNCGEGSFLRLVRKYDQLIMSSEELSELHEKDTLEKRLSYLLE